MEKNTVVIRLNPTFGLWFICHAKSYQNAFRAAFNGYSTREDAAAFSIERGCEVELHPGDQLQHATEPQP